VDTHKDLHVAAVITTLGSLLGSRAFAATRAGYQQLLTWARTFGPLQRAGVECTGSHGAALARHLRTEGVQVIEVNQPDKATRRRRGKTDAIDAEPAARAVLPGRATGCMKTGDGPVEMLRMFKLAKASAIKARTQTINQLKAVLIAADPALRKTSTGLSNPVLFRRCAELPPTTPTTSPAPRSTRFDCWPTGFVNGPARSAIWSTGSPLPSPCILRRCWNVPESAPTARQPCSSRPGRIQTACTTRRPSRLSAASAPCRHPRARHTDAPPKARPAARPSAASNATSPGRSTT
jgi:hypothetical protein